MAAKKTKPAAPGPEADPAAVPFTFLRIMGALEFMEAELERLPDTHPAAVSGAVAAVNYAWHRVSDLRPKLPFPALLPAEGGAP